MESEFDRTSLLLGEEAMERLNKSHVAVFGIGGVGGYVCEMLIRSGVGNLDIIDKDEVSVTNINRQLIALHSTVGCDKVTVMRNRLLDIHPQAQIHCFHQFFLPENIEEFPFDTYDYIVDCVDTVTAKIALISIAHAKQIPMISSMGAGNKLDPSRFRVMDIYQTSMDPLAKVMRRELRKRGISSCKVVCSDEEPQYVIMAEEHGKRIPGSIAFVPAAAGLLLSHEVIVDLIQK